MLLKTHIGAQQAVSVMSHINFKSNIVSSIMFIDILSYSFCILHIISSLVCIALSVNGISK